MFSMYSRMCVCARGIVCGTYDGISSLIEDNCDVVECPGVAARSQLFDSVR